MEYFNVADARKNLKTLLDKVDKEEAVFIKRRDVFYKISLCHNQEQCLKEYYEANGYKKVEKWVKPVVSKNPAPKTGNPCIRCGGLNCEC